MFFIMGIYDKIKEIEFNADMQICQSCGRYCSYKMYVTYVCLSLFFIPVFRWNKRYYVVSSCCGERYRLLQEKGKRAERGEKITITQADIEKEL